MGAIDYKNGVIKCVCPDCRAIANFDDRDSSSEFGSYVIPNTKSGRYGRICYKLFRCTGCHRGGVAEIYCDNRVQDGMVNDFYPLGISTAKVPQSTPDSILGEIREAERCASAQAWRAGSAMLRSALEKIFVENGYANGTLCQKIDEAKQDTIITGSRAKMAHDNIRSLGNDVMHDEWREVTQEDFDTAYHYCQRIIEDFYDARETVENVLASAGRIKKVTK